jgi:Pyruvate/2-oxoacid:ferredoxin oxidoreductase gamma subunit
VFFHVFLGKLGPKNGKTPSKTAIFGAKKRRGAVYSHIKVRKFHEPGVIFGREKRFRAIHAETCDQMSRAC